MPSPALGRATRQRRLSADGSMQPMPRITAERDPNTAARAPLKKRSIQRPYLQLVSDGPNAAPSRRQMRPRTMHGGKHDSHPCHDLDRTTPKFDGSSRIANVNMSNKSPMPTQRSITTLMVAFAPIIAEMREKPHAHAVTGDDGQYLTEKLRDRRRNAHPGASQLPAAHSQDFGNLQPTQAEKWNLRKSRPIASIDHRASRPGNVRRSSATSIWRSRYQKHATVMAILSAKSVIWLLLRFRTARKRGLRLSCDCSFCIRRDGH